jgi:hypothetical protein
MSGKLKMSSIKQAYKQARKSLKNRLKKLKLIKEAFNDRPATEPAPSLSADANRTDVPAQQMDGDRRAV